MKVIAHKNMSDLYKDTENNTYMYETYNKYIKEKAVPYGTKEETLERLYAAVDFLASKARKTKETWRAGIYFETAASYRYFILVLEAM